MKPCPSYLKEYETLYSQDPHAAALAWFRDAKYGMFIHYGLYTLLGRGEWVQYHEKIRVSDYEKLMHEFTAENFDAEKIADLAVASGMKYINFTTRHHDSFCLFRTKETDFNSLNAPCHRDFVGELADACSKRGLGLFLYYSYGADWRHPYFHSREDGLAYARPDYDPPEPSYLYRKPEDFKHYVNFMHNQITELLTQYGPIAGMWFDLISACYYRPDLFPVSETYSLIRKLQPQCLVSFKQGVTGEEDFMSQEIIFEPLAERLIKGGASAQAVEMSEYVWNKNIKKWNEVCSIMQSKGWSFNKEASHKNVQDVLDLLSYTQAKRCNLLLNTGPLPDGSVHKEDEKVFRSVGKFIEENGLPTPNGNALQKNTDTGAGAV